MPIRMIPAALATGLLAGAMTAEAGALTVTIANVEAGKGGVVVRVYDSADNWLSDRWRTRKIVAAKELEGDAVTVAIELPAGVYAVSAFQDVDDDGKLRRNFFGAAAEPAGVSNDAHAFLGSPGFEPAKITLGAEPVELLITLE